MAIVSILKALADETRLRIIALLAGQELNVNELVAVLGMGQSRISRHLKILTDNGLLRCRRDGLWSFYTLEAAGRAGDLVRDTLQCLEELPWSRKDRQRREKILKQRSHQTTRLFDALAGDWQEIKAEIFGELDLNREILTVTPACVSLVDIGCGNGDLLMHLRSRARLVIGVDNSSRMLEQAAGILRQAGGGIDLRLGNIEHLPLGNEEVENAVINMVLHHSDAPQAILQEAGRVLQPRGHLILADFKKHNLESMRSRYGDRHLGFSPEELARYFRECGFRIETEHRFPLSGGLEIILFVTKKEV